MVETPKALAAERLTQMCAILRTSHVARVEELSERLEVSPATVRRDLSELEERGLVRRVHGGAVSIESRLDEPLFDDKTSLAASEKRGIAGMAATMINAADTIYLDGGSTVLELASLLKERTDITVVTNSLRAGIELSGIGPHLIMTGGTLRRRSQTVVGGLSQSVLGEIHVDKAFMGTIGIALNEGLTTTNTDEAFTKKLAMSRASQVVLLADSSKIGVVSFAHAGDIGDIDTLITDANAPAEFVSKLEEEGIDVVRAM
jgi:DeoR/GlpR family transcriptional regulator of sugar metabolism